ncbi:MAG: ribonuclease P protein component [Candidatus Latescibacteria bacterium]|jgi:ribonuclease P protein component|nr:ribonuclease P protein component [Candidatus Latescibacterota bacterium]
MRFSVNNKAAKKVIADGRTLRKSSVNVKYLDGSEYRYSAVLSRKQGSAVQRNKVKRAIREIMRLNEESYPPGFYIIFIKGQCKDFNRSRAKNDLDTISTNIPSGRTS